MGYRDELEASRARIEDLEREMKALRAAPASLRDDSPFAVAIVIVFLLAAGLGVGLAFMWSRASRAETEASDWRRMEGETALELHDAQVRLAEERARRLETIGPVRRCPGDGAADDDVNEWRGWVVERIGDAPAAVAADCTASLVRRNDSGIEECTLSVRCGDRTLYPGTGESGEVDCVAAGAELRARDPLLPATVRVSGSRVDFRLDDGPVGTWAVRIQGPAQ